MFTALKEIFFGNGKSNKTSKDFARSRLHFVLVQDRSGLSPDELAKFKRELVGVIEKYFVVNKQAFDIDYKRESDTTTLLINSPVIVRRQDNPGQEIGARRKDKKDDEKAKDKEQIKDQVQKDEQVSETSTSSQPVNL